MKNLIFTLLLVPIFVCAQNKKEEKKAKKAAGNWLIQIDNQEYVKSWEASGEYFQNAIQKDRWSAALTASRLPLGKLISRKINSSDHQTQLPGAPDGKYYVLEFDVTYENKNTAIETITLSQSSDGIWKVVGFFIK